MPEQELLRELTKIAGPGHVVPGEAASAFAVEGMAPRAAVIPGSPEEVAAVLSLAAERGLAVIPWGGGTQMHLGGRPRAYDLALVLRRLDRIVQYDPDDMTVTVEAGVTLDRLQETLAGAGQFLPVDPPVPGDATVGGILATRAFGPMRLGFRTIADRLIGIKVATANGEVAKAGGRVVKNASGYEMGRLYAGSLGTLAVILEATFKVQPRFEWQEMLALSARDLGEAERLIKGIVHSDALPVLMELVGPYHDLEDALSRLEAHDRDAHEADGSKAAGGAPGGEGALLILGYGGTEESVDWQVGEALRIAKESCGGASGPPAHRRLSWEPVHGLLLDLHGRKMTGEIVLRLHVPDSDLVSHIREALRLARSRGVAARFAAHAGSGTARIALTPASAGLSAAWGEAAAAAASGAAVDNENAAVAYVGIAREIRAIAEAAGGQMIVERAPAALRDAVGVFGEARSDFFLHRAVKEKMDPKGILSPGRFVGGL